MWLWIMVAVVAAVVVGILIMAKRRKKKNYAGADVYRSLLGAAGAAILMAIALIRAIIPPLNKAVQAADEMLQLSNNMRR